MHQRIGILSCLVTVLCVGTPMPIAAEEPVAGLPAAVAGITVTPHNRAARLRFLQGTAGELGARVELFIRNTAALDAGPEGQFFTHAVTFDEQDPQRLIRDDKWSWHDSPSVWAETEMAVPAGALVVWKFNTRSADWGLGKSFPVRVTDWQRARAIEFPIRLEPPRIWLSAVTFLSADGNVMPDTLIFHIVNQSGGPVRVGAARLYLPKTNAQWRLLYPQAYLTQLQFFPSNGFIPVGEEGGARVRTGRLPLGYAALEVTLADAQGRSFSLWAHQRIKRESFDISGGWVQAKEGPVNPLACEPYLKTLKRLHINTAQIAAAPGYTDQTGPNGLYTRYPLKLFGKLEPVTTYDRDAVMPFIHAVEFLGEPQYGLGQGVMFPRAVWQALLPYAKTRLPTTVTLSDESTWRYYAGLSDYPNLNAYRVSAPAADEWELYDRWGEPRIGWGAPLETVGDLCRCLRELSRPGPIACWSQGPHTGWEGLDGRKRAAPTPDEIRLQAYHALSSRITSLYWFNLSLGALVQYRDTLDEINRIGREIKLLEPFYLEGAAYRYQQTRREEQLDWDLASIVGPRGAILFALDLDYTPGKSKVFEFKRPREARFSFDLPVYLRTFADVFRVDADGVYDVPFQPAANGIAISDKQSKVAIYIVSPNRELRPQIEAKRQSLLAYEESFNFDPARRRKDFDELKAASGLKD